MGEVLDAMFEKKVGFFCFWFKCQKMLNIFDQNQGVSRNWFVCSKVVNPLNPAIEI